MAISNLIKPPAPIRTRDEGVQNTPSKASYPEIKSEVDPKTSAHTYVKQMTTTQRFKFKAMLNRCKECGRSVADAYGVEYEPFIEEVKRII